MARLVDTTSAVPVGVSLARVGFVVWAVGSGLLVWSFTALNWYGADSLPTFRDFAHWLPDPYGANTALFEVTCF